MRILIPLVLALPLAACGNVRTASQYGNPSPVAVKNPDYDPYGLWLRQCHMAPSGL